MLKSQLRQDIKALRIQMANLERKCQEREDKVVKFLLNMEPYLSLLAPDVQDKLLKELEESE